MSELKEAVDKSFMDAHIVSCSRVVEKYGKDLSAHIILNIGIVPDGENPADHATYYAVEPFWLGIGSEYDMWNDEEKRFVATKITLDISERKLEEFLKKVPAANECEDVASALAWLVSENSHGAKVRAQFINKPYTDKETGAMRFDHVARLYEVKMVAKSAEDIMASFAKQMAVCKVKFGGKKDAATKKPSAPVAKVTAAPSAPKAPSRVSSKEDVWDFYEKHLIKTDPDASKYWGRVAEAVGKPAEDWAEYTPEDWGKALVHFETASNIPF